eukprot:2684532-Rhodomonas_salina.1
MVRRGCGCDDVPDDTDEIMKQCILASGLQIQSCMLITACPDPIRSSSFIVARYAHDANLRRSLATNVHTPNPHTHARHHNNLNKSNPRTSGHDSKSRGERGGRGRGRGVDGWAVRRA